MPSRWQRSLLAVNAGSSSLRVALFDDDAPARRLARCEVAAIGAEAELREDAEVSRPERVGAADHVAALRLALDRCRIATSSLAAVVHRIVDGGRLTSACVAISPAIVETLHDLAEEDPEHGPAALQLVEAMADLGVPQYACADSAFHRTLPREAQLFALPRALADAGIRRVGYHGLSVESVVTELRRTAPALARGRVIVAHLGGGASLTALRDGRSVETTMGLTPSGGVPMSTRSGDLDPGVIVTLLKRGLTTPGELRALINLRSGLLGLSETTGDMRTLLAREHTDPRAADAVAVFCHNVRKHLGALIAVLGGIDGLVFTGGMGARSAVIRERICRDLESLGLTLDLRANAANAAVISPETARVSVRAIESDEEAMMVAHARKELSRVERRVVSL